MSSQSKHDSPAAIVDGDTIEVIKGEPPDDGDLDQKMQAIKVETKLESTGGDSRSPSLSPSKLKASRTPSATSMKSPDSSASQMEKKEEVIGGDVTLKMEPGQPPKLARSTSQKVTARPPPLFDHYPDATDDAKSTFTVMQSCTYSNKYLGYTEHAMECDCNEEWVSVWYTKKIYLDPDAVAGRNDACGDDSDCINRATKMECVGDCGCGPACQNQRFQQRQYANVSVIKTEKKGYGLRTDSDLRPNEFIFEYIGEVINEPQFRRRMLQYDEEGIKHFYFMSLSKGEFVDATKRGNLGRFCNHSCNPNCYVDKWVVGDKLRMGIFAERKIKAGEELVFNYNVDRYGANPQPCYCGEPNCTGFIGGKTQTERATKLSHATIEALGIEDGDGWDTAVAKRPRKKKVGEDDEEYVDSVQPKSLDADGVTKVMAALMQCKEKWIAVKLLSRIQRCEDEHVRNRIVKMHGYQILNSQLAAWKEDNNVILQILDILDQFPRLTRNKIVDSKIETTLQQFISNEDERVRDQSTRLLDEWSKLEVAYRIPRKKRVPNETATPTKPERNTFERRESSNQDRKRSRSRTRSRSRSPPRGPSTIPSGPRSSLPQRNSHHPSRPPFRRPFNPLPKGWFEATAEGKTYYYSSNGQTQWTRPTAPAAEPPPPPKQPSNQDVLKSIIDNIVTAKEKEREAKNATPDTPQPAPKQKKEKKEEKWRSYDEEKKKKLYENTLFPHISHVMNKYKAKLPREDLKRFAKEIAKKLVNSDFKTSRVEDPTKISEKHEKKVKKFCKDYFDKAVAKHNAHEKRRAEKAKANGKQEGKSSATSPDSKKEDDDAAVLSDAEDDVKMSDDEDGDTTVLDKASSPTSPDTLKRKRELEDDNENGVKLGNNGSLQTPASPSKRLRSQSPQHTPSTSDIVPPPPAPPPPPPMTPDESTQQDDTTAAEDEEATAFAGKSMADVLASAQQDINEDVSMTEQDHNVVVDRSVTSGPNPLTVNGGGNSQQD